MEKKKKSGRDEQHVPMAGIKRYAFIFFAYATQVSLSPDPFVTSMQSSNQSARNLVENGDKGAVVDPLMTQVDSSLGGWTRPKPQAIEFSKISTFSTCLNGDRVPGINR